MRKFIWLLGGVCAAAAGWLVLGSNRVKPIQNLAHQLEDAWADHHTRV